MAKEKIASIAAVFATCVNVAVFAGGVEAVDWSTVSGTYTVPANTTNEITTASDFDYFTNRVTRVDFGNENSTLRFGVSTFPTDMPFKGYGTVLMSEKVLLSANTVLHHANGTNAGAKPLRFVFTKGIDSVDGSTTYSLSPSPSDVCFFNAIISIQGPVSHVAVSALNFARIDVGENAYLETSEKSLGYNGRKAMIRQRGGVVCKRSAYFGQRYDSEVAYLMDGGVLTNSTATTDYQRFYVYGRYFQFRQTGGFFNCTRSWYRPFTGDNIDPANTVPFDFVFGGSAVATNDFFEFYGDLNLVVMDGAVVKAGTLKTNNDEYGQFRHILAMNGGVLCADIPGTARNTYFAFNGGTLRRSQYDSAYMFGNNEKTGNTAWVRIYEKGGTIDITDRNTIHLPHLKAPVGNVVRTVAVTDELTGKVFQTPPAVVIADATGAGSNAVAIVDYDFDSCKVTNVTVLCMGENYSGGEGDVTAQIYLNGAAQLSTPLVCTVGPCDSGPVTFAATTVHTINSGSTTNTYRGLTIIDMDTSRSYDHTATDVAVPSFCINVNDRAYEPHYASTGLVVRSGCFGRDYINSFRPDIKTYFRDLERLELYGGYFFGFSVTNVPNVVIGGETWLKRPEQTDGLSNVYYPILTIPSDGTLTVDVSCLTNGVTPTLKYGNSVNFASGAKITVRNWEVIPDDDAYHTLLDLSEVTTVNGTPEVEIPDGLSGKAQIRWNSATRKLMMRRSRGLLMILL